MTVAVAYRSPVRTTRIDYRAVAISFKFVLAKSLDEVAQSFNADVDRNDRPDDSGTCSRQTNFGKGAIAWNRPDIHMDIHAAFQGNA